MRLRLWLGVFMGCAVGCAEEPNRDEAWCQARYQEAEEAWSAANACDTDKTCGVGVVLCGEGGFDIGKSLVGDFSEYERRMKVFRRGGCVPEWEESICDGIYPPGCHGQTSCSESKTCTLSTVCETSP